MNKWIYIELKPGMEFFDRRHEYEDGTKAIFTHIVKDKGMYRLHVTDGKVSIKPIISKELIEDSAINFWEIIKWNFDEQKDRLLNETY